ncbi:hypothetical protein L6452_42184 [Arctium lappa]|uniref:Uncharacterized protein n=1 Tax=Arctium lappa TaxID=4217 RepID=A0ACB8XHH8_ARCLA|nr:hypothetical protein L6452_42184 [Arctium lappa]
MGRSEPVIPTPGSTHRKVESVRVSATEGVQKRGAKRKNSKRGSGGVRERDWRHQGHGLLPLLEKWALSASGLSAIRYAREMQGIRQVVALTTIMVGDGIGVYLRNIKFNGSVASEKVESNLADARVYMLTHPKKFDVV